MYQFLVKRGQTIGFLLGVVVVVLFLATALNGISTWDSSDTTTDRFNIGLGGAVALTLIAAAAMVLFGLFNIATNLKSSLKGLIGFAVLVVIALIAYSTANGDITNEIRPIQETAAKTGGVDGGSLKFIGGAISTAVILIGIAFLAFILAEVRNLFR